MRYSYTNKAYKQLGAPNGLNCDPVKGNGKCVVGNGSQLVVFENGVRAVVVRRCLRLNRGNKNDQNI